MSLDAKNEYILQTIKLMEEDKKSLLLYVAFDFAVVALTFAGDLSPVGDAKSPGIAIALLLLFASGALFFGYYRKIHLATFEVVEELLTQNTDSTRTIRKSVWSKHWPRYIVGYLFRVTGVVLLVSVYFLQVNVTLFQ